MIEEIFDLTWAWIIVGLALAGLEIVVSGIFLLWIGMGAFAVGLILALLPNLPIAWQALVFATTMLTSLSFGFWVQRRGVESKEAIFLNREMAAMVGQRYLAIAPFEAGRGRIKVADSSYAAVSDEPIVEGELVEVTEVEDGKPRVVRVTK